MHVDDPAWRTSGATGNDHVEVAPARRTSTFSGSAGRVEAAGLPEGIAVRDMEDRPHSSAAFVVGEADA